MRLELKVSPIEEPSVDPEIDNEDNETQDNL